MRTYLSIVLALPLAVGACSRSRGKAPDTVPPAPEFATQRPTAVESRELASSPAENAIPPEDQIFFAHDSDALDVDSRSLLTEVATWVMSAPGRQIVLEGHADASGTAEHNLELSTRRAFAAASYLRQLNVPPERVVVTAVGERESSLEPAHANRRVVIFATRAQSSAAR